MNYCRKCQSDYEKPGTCNCWAPQEAGKKIDPVSVPWIQTPPYYQPWWVGPYQWGTATATPCSVCGQYNCFQTHVIYFGGDLNGSATTVTDDLAPTTTTATLAAWGKSMTGGDTSHMVDS